MGSSILGFRASHCSQAARIRRSSVCRLCFCFRLYPILQHYGALYGPPQGLAQHAAEDKLPRFILGALAVYISEQWKGAFFLVGSEPPTQCEAEGKGEEVVLCLQDGTDLNFAEHPGCAGLGLISKNKGAAGTLGLHMHSTLVVNGAGLPLGVPHIQYEAPDGQAEKNKPLEQRKTNRWLRGLQQCAEFADQLDGVRPVAVMDREADVFDLFAEQHRLGTVDLLVRAKHNHSLGKDLPKLFDAVQAKPVQAHLEMHVARSSARRGTRRQKARAGRKAREAKLALRWCAVAIASAEQELLPGSGTASAQPRACLRRVGARQPRAPGMVPVDLLAGDIQTAGPQNPQIGIACAGASKTGTACSSPAARSNISAIAPASGLSGQ